jgi:hypothetical protein
MNLELLLCSQLSELIRQWQRLVSQDICCI